MYFKKNLNYLTATCGKSIKEVAEDLSIGYDTYRTYLKVSQPKYEVLIAIAQYFHITLDDLLMRDIEKEGHFETNKNDIIDKGAASVYIKNNMVPDLNAVVTNLIQAELQPLQHELNSLKSEFEALKNSRK